MPTPWVRTSLLCQLINSVHDVRKGTYVVVTHDLNTLRTVSDYIGVLWQGKLVHHGTAASTFESQDPFVRQFLSGQPDGPLGMD